MVIKQMNKDFGTSGADGHCCYFDNTYMWVGEDSYVKLYLYDSGLGILLDTDSSVATRATGIASNGTYVFVLDTAGDIHTYSISGTSIVHESTNTDGVAAGRDLYWSTSHNRLFATYGSGGLGAYSLSSATLTQEHTYIPPSTPVLRGLTGDSTYIYASGDDFAFDPNPPYDIARVPFLYAMTYTSGGGFSLVDSIVTGTLDAYDPLDAAYGWDVATDGFYIYMAESQRSYSAYRLSGGSLSWINKSNVATSHECVGVACENGRIWTAWQREAVPQAGSVRLETFDGSDFDFEDQVTYENAVTEPYDFSVSGNVVMASGASTSPYKPNRLFWSPTQKHIASSTWIQ